MKLHQAIYRNLFFKNERNPTPSLCYDIYVSSFSVNIPNPRELWIMQKKVKWDISNFNQRWSAW